MWAWLMSALLLAARGDAPLLVLVSLLGVSWLVAQERKLTGLLLVWIVWRVVQCQLWHPWGWCLPLLFAVAHLQAVTLAGWQVLSQAGRWQVANLILIALPVASPAVKGAAPLAASQGGRSEMTWGVQKLVVHLWGAHCLHCLVWRMLSHLQAEQLMGA